MDGVNAVRAELGHLPVLVHPVLLVQKISFAVGGKASTVSNADKVGSEPLQLELSLTLLVRLKPGLTQVDDVSLEEGGIDPQVCHVWTQPSNVERRHPDLDIHKLVPVSRILVKGSRNCKMLYLMRLKNMRYNLKFKYLMKLQSMRYCQNCIKQVFHSLERP